MIRHNYHKRLPHSDNLILESKKKKRILGGSGTNYISKSKCLQDLKKKKTKVRVVNFPLLKKEKNDINFQGNLKCKCNERLFRTFKFQHCAGLHEFNLLLKHNYINKKQTE